MAKIVLGSDHGGFEYKNAIVEHLNSLGYEVTDIGTDSTASCDYPDIAKNLVKQILDKKAEKGILICGTGIGMSIVANRSKGIRASVCNDTYTARLTKMHNNSNVLCLGQRVIGIGVAIDIVDTWLNTEFEGGRHQKRIDKID